MNTLDFVISVLVLGFGNCNYPLLSILHIHNMTLSINLNLALSS